MGEKLQWKPESKTEAKNQDADLRQVKGKLHEGSEEKSLDKTVYGLESSQETRELRAPGGWFRKSQKQDGLMDSWGKICIRKIREYKIGIIIVSREAKADTRKKSNYWATYF